MNTPIADFVKKYAKSSVSRFHMPGHKGKKFLGCEKLDITEIDGADVLSFADGIIGESEKTASHLFKTTHTFYTTQGSTTAICAMLALTGGKKILAARNVHKAFIHACALLDFDAEWLMPETPGNLLSCQISGELLETKLASLPEKPSAVYITSPDYLGNIQNIPEISAVCKKHGIPLLVDNAHGAYLAFLKNSLHPIHLGADMCCDSAHKTLPVLTGGAYLHIANSRFLDSAREKLSLFSSTSPSYLILQSLDLCNKYLENRFEKKLEKCINKISALKNFIKSLGFLLPDTEPLKITVDAQKSGYTGYELAEILRKNKIEPEFCDRDFLVLMVTPQNCDKDFKRLKKAFARLKAKTPIKYNLPELSYPQTKLSVRESVFAPSETIDVDDSVGRVCASPTVSCPPAVPIAVSGEEITAEHIKLFKHYGIDKIKVVR